MSFPIRSFWQKLKGREKRLILYLGVVLAFAAWKFTPRYWKPTTVLETSHYLIHSTATREQTEQLAAKVEILYNAYSNRLGSLPAFKREHPKLKLLLYKDREEFRRINPGSGWAEAFYSKPYCRAYYAANEANPYHWMLHETVHQLNEEVAGLKLQKWLEEGLAEYFSVSRIEEGEVRLGTVDPEVYPIWWIDEIATDRTVEANLANESVIPIQVIVTHRGGPSLNSRVNLYYLHWWSLTHYVFEDRRHRNKAQELLQHGGDLETFERLIGPIEATQARWHEHLRTIKTTFAAGEPYQPNNADRSNELNVKLQ